MSKTSLEQDLVAAHLNTLHQTLSAVETQVASIKTLLKMMTAPVGARAEVSDTETPAETTKAKRGRPAKTARAEEDNEEVETASDDAAEEEESDDDSFGDDEEEEETGEKEYTLKDVITSLRTYAKDNSKAAAVKMLKKYGGVDSVQKLPKTKYATLIEHLN